MKIEIRLDGTQTIELRLPQWLDVQVAHGVEKLVLEVKPSEGSVEQRSALEREKEFWKAQKARESVLPDKTRIMYEPQPLEVNKEAFFGSVRVRVREDQREPKSGGCWLCGRTSEHDTSCKQLPWDRIGAARAAKRAQELEEIEARAQIEQLKSEKVPDEELSSVPPAEWPEKLQAEAVAVVDEAKDMAELVKENAAKIGVHVEVGPPVKLPPAPLAMVSTAGRAKVQPKPAVTQHQTPDGPVQLSTRIKMCDGCKRNVDTDKEAFVGGICINCTVPELRPAAKAFHKNKGRKQDEIIDCTP